MAADGGDDTAPDALKALAAAGDDNNPADKDEIVEVDHAVVDEDDDEIDGSKGQNCARKQRPVGNQQHEHTFRRWME